MALFTFSIAHTSAQDAEFDELSLNGLSAFSQLRKEYYIGGLYLETLSSNADTILASDERMRMQLRVTIENWPARRFARQWNQLILINSDANDINSLSDQILTFIDLPKEDLIKGDIITIDRDPSQGTTVYLNGSKVFNVEDNTFFNILLSTWIGQRPPSSDFKNSILTLGTDTESSAFLTRYEAVETSSSRKSLVSNWFNSKPASKNIQPKQEDVSVASSINKRPPSEGTSVRARQTSQPEKKSTSKAIASSNQTIEIEKPSFDIGGPSIAGPTSSVSSTAKAKPVAKPVAKAPLTVVKTEEPVAQTVSKEEQTKLFNAYRSQVLRLAMSNTEYPKRAIDRNQKGIVFLTIKIDRDGKLLETIETEPSKYKLLNKAAIKAVEKAARSFPKVPDDLLGETITMDLPFYFQF